MTSIGAGGGRDLVGERDRVEVAWRDDRVVESEVAALLELLGSTRGPDDGAAHRVRELDRGGADAGSGGVNEHHFARFERRPA